MKNPKFASRTGYGYTIVTTGAGTARCGGVSLLSRKSDLFSIEEAKPWGSNIILWEMQVGEEKEERWYCVGCYLPPSDKKGEAQQLLTRAMQQQPSGTRLMVLGDLNANLDVPWTTQEDVLAAEMAEHGLVCATR